jgi:hypothetical protein
MNKALADFWRWSRRRGKGFDYFSFCVGTPGLLILMSERVWSKWLHLPTDSQWLHYFGNSWLLCLGIISVWWLQGGRIERRLVDTGHSKWWTVPLLFTMIALVASTLFASVD